MKLINAIPLLLCAFGAASPSAKAQANHKMPRYEAFHLERVDQQSHDRYYTGTITLQGDYYMDARGPLRFAPQPKFIGLLPEMHQGEVLEFADEDAAIEALHLKASEKKLDGVKYAMFVGTARITIKNFYVGDGPARKWHTADFVKKSYQSQPRMVLSSESNFIDSFYKRVEYDNWGFQAEKTDTSP